MKSFKEYELYEANMTDSEIEVRPTSVKMGKDGKVSSYKLDVKMDGKSIKDSKLHKALVNYLGDSDLKDSIAISPKALIVAMEVYSDDNGKYIELGKSKAYFKG